ncbi:MAG: PAS domain S-box protein [candidate division Zixibacteria bacterium]|nr:PAS domain S-box protein [candidate division Zixibacteria bacterium]
MTLRKDTDTCQGTNTTTAFQVETSPSAGQRLTLAMKSNVCPDVTCEVTRLRGAADTLPHAIGIVSTDGTILHAGEQFAELVKTDSRTLVGKSFRDLLDPVSHQEYPCLVAGERCPDHWPTLLWKTRDSHDPRWLKLSLREIRETGQSCGCYSFCVSDITARVHHHDRFCADHRRMEDLFNACMDGVNITDNLHIVDVNPAHERMFGYSREESIGLPVRTFVAPEAWDMLAKELKPNGNKRYETIGLRKDGTRFILEVNSREHQFNGRRMNVATVRDITPFREAEKALQEAGKAIEADRAALREKNNTLQEVLRQIDSGKQEVKQQIQANIDRIALPTIKALRQRLDASDHALADLIEQCLTDISEPFLDTAEQKFASLTSRELNICYMIRNGMSSKEIADTLHISEQTVVTHRKAIRKKLHIDNQDINLAAYLNSLA